MSTLELRKKNRAIATPLYLLAACIVAGFACDKKVEPTKSGKPTIDDCARIAENLAKIVELPLTKTTTYEKCKEADREEVWVAMWCLGDAKTLADVDRCGVPKGDVEETVEKMKTFADAMCECRDKACAEKVTADMVVYGEEMAKKHEGKAEPAVSDAQKKEMETAMKKLTECTAKAMGG